MSRDERETTEISLVGIVNILLRRRKLILLAALGGMLLLAAHALLRAEPSYTAEGRFIPEGESPDLGGGASMVQQLRGGAASGKPAFYAALLSTRELLREAVQHEYPFTEEDGGTGTATLVDIYGVGGPTEEDRIEAAARRLGSDVTTKVDDRTGIVTLSVTQGHPGRAEAIAATMLELVDEFNRRTRRSQAANELEFIAARMEEASAELREVEGALRRFLEGNRQFRNSPELLFEHERLQRELELRQELLTSLARSYDRARMDQARTTRLITLIDPPTGSAARDAGSRTGTMAMVGLILGLVMGVILAFVLEFFRRAAEGSGQEHEEFKELRAEAARELRSPVRWVEDRGGRSAPERTGDRTRIPEGGATVRRTDVGGSVRPAGAGGDVGE